MKRSEIKNKYPYCEITINSNEAKRLLIDLKVIDKVNLITPETKHLIRYLEELIEK